MDTREYVVEDDETVVVSRLRYAAEIADHLVLISPEQRAVVGASSAILMSSHMDVVHEFLTQLCYERGGDNDEMRAFGQRLYDVIIHTINVAVATERGIDPEALRPTAEQAAEIEAFWEGLDAAERGESKPSPA